MNDTKIFEGLPQETKELAQSIEKLKKSLDGLGDAASSLDALTSSLKNLKTVSNSLEKLTNVINGLSQLTQEINSFRKSIRYLNRATDALSNLSKTFTELKNSTNFLKNTKKDVEQVVSTETITKNEKGLEKTASGLNKVARETSNVDKEGKEAEKTFKKLEKRLNSFGKIFSIGGLVFGFKRLSSVLGKAFKESNDYIEVLNLFTVAMGDHVNEAKNVVDSWQQLLGLDPKQAMERWGAFQLLLEGFGDSSEEWNKAAYGMSRNLTQLSYDFASLYNVDPNIAMTRLQSAMSGMTRPLRTWGIDVSTLSLEVFAKEKGIEKSVHLMPQAEKAQLRYMLIMHKTSQAMMGIQGDLAKTLLTPGNAIRILKQQLVQLKRAFGDFLAPIISEYIPYIVAFVKGLTGMLSNLSKVMDELLGYQRLTTEDFKKVTDNMDSVAGATEDAADATDEYSNSLHGLLSGIDKFNVLSQAKKGLGGEMFLSDADIEEYDFFKNLKDASTAILEQLKPAFDKAQEKITRVLKVIKELGITLEDVKNVIIAILALKVAGFITEVIIGISGLSTAFSALSTAQAMAKTNMLGMTVGIGIVIYAGYQLYKLIKDLSKNWDEMTEKEKALKIFLSTVAFGFTAIGTAIAAISIKGYLATFSKAITTQVIPALQALNFNLASILKSTIAIGAAILAITWGITTFIKLFKEMSAAGKFITIILALAVAITTLAISLAALKTGIKAALVGAAIAGGIALGVGSIIAANSKKKFAEGGFIGGGNMFIAGERGPEWVGKQGGSSVIVNDQQMSDIMYRSVKDGVIDALIRTDGGNTKVELNFTGMDKNDLARVMLKPIIDEARRQGYKFERS